MSASAGTVTVDFAAEVARFNQSLKTVEGRLKSMDQGLKSVALVAKTALGFLSVGVGVNFIKSAAQAADAMGKLADTLEISTSQLKAFQIAADEAGIAQQTINKTLVDSQQRLGEAAQGRGEALKFIEALHLNVRDLQALSPDQLFLKYADAIDDLANRSDQFAAAQALFGRSAKEAFTLIANGAPAIADAAAFVDRFGLALSRVDIAQIEAANDALGRLGTIGQAAGQRIAAGLSPFLEAFANSVMEATGSTEELQRRAEQFGAAVSVAFQLAANTARSLQAAFFGLAAAGARALQTLTFGDVSESFAASVDANLTKANLALAQIQSIEQIQERIVTVLEQSRLRAEQLAATAAAAAANRTLSLPGTPSTEQDIAAFVEAEFQKASRREELWARFDADFDVRRIEAERRLAEEKFRINEHNENAIQSMRERTQDMSVGFLQVLGTRHKAFAIAAIALEKGLAITRLLSQVTATAALAGSTQLIPGDPTSLARAAAAKAAWLSQGVQQAALIAATGAVQIANIVSPPGGGRAGLGAPGNPIFTQPGGEEQQFGATSQRAVHITVNGNLFSSQQTVDWLMDQIADRVNHFDNVFIDGRSLQGQIIRSEG